MYSNSGEVKIEPVVQPVAQLTILNKAYFLIYLQRYSFNAHKQWKKVLDV